MARQLKPKPARCVFCGDDHLNFEHVLGKWSKPFIPRIRPNFKQLRAIQHTTHSTFDVHHRAGDPDSMKVWCACIDCNGGWMSKLQNNMKPLGIKMATGKTTRLDGRDQLKAAAWAAMVAITSEYDYFPDIAIAQDDRAFLRANLYPSNRFRIWLGHILPGTWNARLVRHPFGISYQTEPDHTVANTVRNTLLTTRVLGQMLVHVMYSVHEDFVHDWTFPPDVAGRLIQIWPVKSPTFWPPLRPLDDRAATITASGFFNFSIESRRKHRISRGLDPDK